MDRNYNCILVDETKRDTVISPVLYVNESAIAQSR